MSIKNIKEKELLINLSKTFGQDIDPSIVEEVNRQKEFEKSIKDSARNNWIKDLQEALSSIKQDVDEIKEQTNYPVPPSLDELEAFLSETTEEVNDLVSQPQSGESATESVESEQAPETIIERTARAIKVNENSFQQPSPPAPDAQLKSLVQKVRFLEQWLGKVSVAGPGGGESSQAGLYMPIRAVTTNSYTATSKDYYIGVNYAGAVTIYLPIAMNPGRKFTVKDELGEASKGTNRHITVMSAGSDKIDDRDKAILAYDYGSLTFVYRPGNWRVV